MSKTLKIILAGLLAAMLALMVWMSLEVRSQTNDLIEMDKRVSEMELNIPKKARWTFEKR